MKKLMRISIVMLLSCYNIVQADNRAQGSNALMQTEFPLMHQYVDHRFSKVSPTYVSAYSDIEAYLASVHNRFMRLAKAACHISADATKSQQEKEQAAMDRFNMILQETTTEHLAHVAAADLALQKLGLDPEYLYPFVARMTFDVLKDAPLAMRTFMCTR